MVQDRDPGPYPGTPPTNAVIESSRELYNKKDEVALELLLGMRARAIERNPGLANDPDFEPTYDTETMGRLDDLKGLGQRIVDRWNKELCQSVCGNQEGDQAARTAVLGALNLGEVAVIGGTASALLALGLAPALAAVLAPLLVKRIIWPARDELCAAWLEVTG